MYQKETEKLKKQIRTSFISMEYKARERKTKVRGILLSASISISISIDSTQLYEHIP